MIGVYAIHRGIWTHPLFSGEKFSEREAWLWLVSEAAWKSRVRRTRGSVISLERGQLCHSERFMAEAWQWTKSKVHRFLVLLESEQMIERKSDHQTNLISICNYEKYAFDGTDKQTESEPTANRSRTKLEEVKKDKKERIDIAGWRPHEKHIALAISLKVDIRDVEETFRDYVANHPRKYRDFDAAFRQFLKNAPKFNGAQHGKTAGNLVDAAGELRDTIGRAAGLCSSEGATVVCLLPQERSTRPQNIRGGGDGGSG